MLRNILSIIGKIWKRRAYVYRAVLNWSTHCLDVIAYRNSGKPDGKRVIVFIRAISDIRLFKQAKALRNTGEFYTVFFTKVLDRSLMQPAFDEIHPIISINKMVRKIESISRKADIVALHISSPPANICRRLIEMKLPWPVIFDQYDSWMVTMGPDYKGDSSERMYNLEQQIADEKFSFENANGIISKTTEIEYVKSILDIKAPSLIYPDYAFEDWFVEPQEPMRWEDGRPHLVYIGSIYGKEVPDEMGYSKFFDFARNLNEQRIHFHIYPSPTQTIIYKEYKNLDKELPFFHFHKSKNPWEIQKEIAKYDFALDVAWFDKAPSVREEKRSTATGNKYATYLEAGLPIIANVPYIANYVRKWEIGFIISDDQYIFDNKFMLRRKEYQKNVLKKRMDFNCDSHVKELINLYEEGIKEWNMVSKLK